MKGPYRIIPLSNALSVVYMCLQLSPQMCVLLGSAGLLVAFLLQITNVAKLKRLKKKQLRAIEKR